MRTEYSSLTLERALAVALAILTMCAGVIHMAMVPMHVDHRLSMLLFLAGGVAQFAVSAYLFLGRRRDALIATLLVNGGAVALWVMTRTTGIRFLPGFESRQHIEAADVAATAFELAAIATAAIALLLPRRSAAARVSSVLGTPAVSALGLASIVLLAAALTVPSDHSGHAHSPGGHSAGAHDHGSAHLHALEAAAHAHAPGKAHEHDDDHRVASDAHHAAHGHSHASGTGGHAADAGHAGLAVGSRHGGHAHDGRNHEGRHGDHAHEGHDAHDEPGHQHHSPEEPEGSPPPEDEDQGSGELNALCSWYAEPAAQHCP